MIVLIMSPGFSSGAISDAVSNGSFENSGSWDYWLADRIDEDDWFTPDTPYGEYYASLSKYFDGQGGQVSQDVTDVDIDDLTEFSLSARATERYASIKVTIHFTDGDEDSVTLSVEYDNWESFDLLNSFSQSGTIDEIDIMNLSGDRMHIDNVNMEYETSGGGSSCPPVCPI